jgi:uncharacterized membrane protein
LLIPTTMNDTLYLKAGKIIFATALVAFGLIHIINQNFPVGLIPVPATVPGRLALVNIAGIALIAAGLMLFTNKLTYYGALTAGVVWALLIIFLHLPLLLMDLSKPNAWTGTFECLMLLSGTLVIIDGCFPFHKKPKYSPALIARYLYMSGLVAFAVMHYIYLQYLATLVPVWLPGHVVWAWVVLAAFSLSAISILINKQAKLAFIMLAIMYLTWVVILHLPRAFAKMHSEPEWTSTCVALAVGGIALLLAGNAKK